jgi:hypothetical protein
VLLPNGTAGSDGWMYLNIFATGSTPLDMTGTDEFRSLLASAADLGISHAPQVPYRSCNIVLRHMRFHFLEWGHQDAPAVVLLHGGHQSAHSWDLVSLHLGHATGFWRWTSAATATASGRAMSPIPTTRCHSMPRRSSSRWVWKDRS